MSVFKDRIQAIKITSSNIQTDVHLDPGKLWGSNFGSFPNVHARVYYETNTPHFWMVKLRLRKRSRPIVKTSLNRKFCIQSRCSR